MSGRELSAGVKCRCSISSRIPLGKATSMDDREYAMRSNIARYERLVKDEADHGRKLTLQLLLDAEKGELLALQKKL